MAPHVFGASDPEGFAAMGVVETLVHTHDIAQGLNRLWEPPQDLSERVLARLFPDIPVIEVHLFLQWIRRRNRILAGQRHLLLINRQIAQAG